MPGAMGVGVGGITIRNPMMILGLTTGLLVIGNVLSNALGGITFIFALVGMLGSIGGWVCLSLFTFQMAKELKAFTNNPAINPIWCWIPCLQIYYLVLQVPGQVAQGKQMAGVQKPTRAIWMYFLLPAYSFALDMNDIATPAGQAPPAAGIPGM